MLWAERVLRSRREARLSPREHAEGRRSACALARSSPLLLRDDPGILHAMADIEMDASRLADLLSSYDSTVLWTVDGAEQLSGTLDFPCDGRNLAEALRRLGGRVRVYGAGTQSPTTLQDIADNADGRLVLSLAFVTSGGAGEPWIIMQDTIAEQEVLRATGTG